MARWREEWGFFSRKAVNINCKNRKMRVFFLLFQLASEPSLIFSFFSVIELWEENQSVSYVCAIAFRFY